MTSTISNIDVEQLVYAFSGLVATKIVTITEPSTHFQSRTDKEISPDNQEEIEDEVGEILKESFLHPLYKEEVEEELVCEGEDAYSEGEQDEDRNTSLHNEFQPDKMMESSFLGGESVDFGVTEQPLKIFDQTFPTSIDYFKPTIDSVSNFIKNIVLTAKM